MEADELCQKIAQWFQKHRHEQPFAFGEIHLLTGEPGADIWLIIGKIAKETTDKSLLERQWKNTLYDHPVTWMWQKLADEEADGWLRHIYEQEFLAKKRAMLTALLELAKLIESNGYEILWEAEEEDVWLTEIPIRRVVEVEHYETERWQELLAAVR
ncbi:hypothetical protein [Candidatus Magnetaquicoccus inordinatus]|uniref:hypothetical protein n=1 Tax=Candidatus Magnetaquicoccus inordinatus TaxID=2496818 RepID=UPI00102AE81E|nr:hypothetical protein [Candidatus Magnetaquicoccus inordinatus]